MKRSPLLILAGTLFLDLLGFGLILPLLPIYITHYGGKPWVGGALLACFSLAQFLFTPFWGRLSDRVGRRPLILLSLVGSSISFLGFGLAQNLTVLFLARIAAGILSSASLPSAQAYIADVTTPENRSRGMAMLGAAFGAGFALGPWIGSELGKFSLFGLPAIATPSLAAAGLSFLNFLWAFFLLPESHTDRRETEHAEAGALEVFPAISRAMNDPAVRAQLIVFTVVTFAFTALESCLSWLILIRFHGSLLVNARLDWEAAHPAQHFAALAPLMQQQLLEKAQALATGHMFGVVGISMVITQIAVMRGLAHRFGEHKLVMFGTGMLVFAILGVAFTHSLLVLGALGVAVAAASGLLNPSLNALITQSAGPQERGTLSGVQQGLGSLARIVAPPVNNYLVGVNTAIPFIGSSLLMVAAFLLSLRLRPLAGDQPVQPLAEDDTAAKLPQNRPSTAPPPPLAPVPRTYAPEQD